MNDLIRATRERMVECSVDGFRASEQFGKGSPEHLLKIVLFSDAAKVYEEACKAVGKEPYATYSID